MPGNRPRERNSQLVVPKANELNTAQRGLWVYTGGNVRQVYRRAFDLDEGNYHIPARIVEATSPVNPGDRGGPVLNDEGEIDVLNEEMIAAGIRVFVGGLHPVKSAKSPRAQPGGKVPITDGPYLETKQHIGGFWVLDATDMNEALEWGARPS